MLNKILFSEMDGSIACNWWGVKVKDKEIQEELYDNGWQFNITNEWDSDEMHTLVDLLGIEVTDI